MVNNMKWEDNDRWVEVDLDLCIGAADCVCPTSAILKHSAW